MRKVILLLLATLGFLGLKAQLVPSGTPEQWMEEGRAAMGEENYSKAAELYSRVIQFSGNKSKDDLTPTSGYLEAVYSRAVCYFYLDNLEEAISDLDLFLSKVPSFPQAYILKSVIYQRQQNFYDQLKTLNSALPLFQDSDKHRLYRLRAGAYLGLEKVDSAFLDLRRALTVEEDAEGMAMLGFIQYKRGDYDSAMISLNKAIGLDHSFLSTFQYAASFCLEMNQVDKALTYINLGLLSVPETPELLFLKGVIYKEKGRFDEACSLFNRAFYAGVDDAGDYLSEYCYPIER